MNVGGFGQVEQRCEQHATEARAVIIDSIQANADTLPSVDAAKLGELAAVDARPHVQTDTGVWRRVTHSPTATSAAAAKASGTAIWLESMISPFMSSPGVFEGLRAQAGRPEHL